MLSIIAILAVVFTIKMGRNLDRSDLTELRQSYEEGLDHYISTYLKNNGLLGKKTFCGRNLEVWNTYTYLCDNLMHFKYFGVYIKGEIMSVNLSKLSFVLYIGVG